MLIRLWLVISITWAVFILAAVNWSMAGETLSHRDALDTLLIAAAPLVIGLLLARLGRFVLRGQ